jgi:ribonucleoside-diphosphate reductase beta chain
MPNKEPILKDNKDRFVIFPVKHNDIWDYFKQMQSAFWTANEIDLHKDLQDWNHKLSSREKDYLSLLLTSMAAWQAKTGNATATLMTEVQDPGARSFFSFQHMMENTHWETFSLLLNFYVPEEFENEELPERVASLKTTSKRLAFNGEFERAAFGERLVAMAARKGIFFSGAFCALARMRNKNLLPGLGFSGGLIARDLEIHRNFAIHLHNNHLVERVSKARIREILLQAFAIENDFNTHCLPVNQAGLNPVATEQYLEFVTDNLLVAFGCEKEFGSENPFGFMETSGKSSTGILEKRAGELRKAGTAAKKEELKNNIKNNAGQ